MKNLGQNRVILISPTESAITERGKRHPNLADFLVSNGWHVVYITSTINHAAKELLNLNKINNLLSSAKYDIHFINCGLYRKNVSIRRFIWNIMFALRVYQKLQKIVKSDDIIIFPSRPPELLLVGSLLKSRYNINLLVDVEDIWPDAFIVKNNLIKKVFYKYCNRLNHSSLSNYSIAFYVSPNFHTWILRYANNLDAIYAPLGITSEEDLPSAKKEYSSSQISFNLFYGGTLSLQFDILPLLKAVELSKVNFTITLAGDDGSGSRFNTIIEFLANSNIDYILHRNLEKKEFLQVLSQADIAVIPMISGGLPKKFFDALGCFKPMICLGEGGAQTEITKNNLGWVTDWQIENIVSVLDTINVESIMNRIESITAHRDFYLESNTLIKMERAIRFIKN